MHTTLMTIAGMLFLPLMTTLGAATVFFFRGESSPKFDTLCLGFASGIMIAASVWSLLIPSIEASSSYGTFSFLPAALGFLLGGLLLVLLDILVPHFHPRSGEEEGPRNHLGKPLKLFLAVTVHNIPEGLAVGFAFGAAATAGSGSAYLAALALAFGIGVQNLPEGAAVALPLRAASGGRKAAFWLGTLGGAVEPVAALIGYFLAASLSPAQPWLLAFSAGAMIFVVAEDLIPDAKLEEHPHLGTWGVMLGFALMMILDVSLS